MNQIQVSIIKGFHTLSLKTYKCALRPLKEIIYDPKREKRESYSFDVDSVRIQISLSAPSLFPAPSSCPLSFSFTLKEEIALHIYLYIALHYSFSKQSLCVLSLSLSPPPLNCPIFSLYIQLSCPGYFILHPVCMSHSGVTGSSKQKIWAALANTNLKL